MNRSPFLKGDKMTDIEILESLKVYTSKPEVIDRAKALVLEDDNKFCRKCGWNDCDYGCTCPMNERVYQCPLYMYYHPEEVKKFNDACEKWIKRQKRERVNK